MEEIIQTIPLDIKKAPRNKRARRAIKDIKRFVRKRTDKEIKIDHELNNAIWSKGIQKPPASIRVKIVDYDEWVTVQPPEKEVVTRDFECDECGKTFTTQEGLDMHMQTSHTSQKEETEETETTTDTEDEMKDSEVDYKEILSGTIKEAKAEIEKIEEPDYEKLLETEKNNKDRKGIKTFLEKKIDV